MMDQLLAEGGNKDENGDVGMDKIDQLRDQANLFYTGNMLFLHYIYSCDIISAEFLTQYLEFFMGNIFEQNPEGESSNITGGQSNDSENQLNLAKVMSESQVKLYLYLILKYVRKKDASSFSNLVDILQKYLDSSLILQIKAAEIRESFSKGVRAFDSKIEKLEKNMDIGTHEMEINSFLLKFLSKGIKNAQKLENLAHLEEDCPSIQCLYDVSFNEVQDDFLESIGLEDTENPIWKVFHPKNVENRESLANSKEIE